MCFSSRLQRVKLDTLERDLDLETSHGRGPCRHCSRRSKTSEEKLLLLLRSDEIAFVCTQQHRRCPVRWSQGKTQAQWCWSSIKPKRNGIFSPLRRSSAISDQMRLFLLGINHISSHSAKLHFTAKLWEKFKLTLKKKKKSKRKNKWHFPAEDLEPNPGKA